MPGSFKVDVPDNRIQLTDPVPPPNLGGSAASDAVNITGFALDFVRQRRAEDAAAQQARLQGRIRTEISNQVQQFNAIVGASGAQEASIAVNRNIARLAADPELAPFVSDITKGIREATGVSPTKVLVDESLRANRAEEKERNDRRERVSVELGVDVGLTGLNDEQIAAIDYRFRSLDRKREVALEENRLIQSNLSTQTQRDNFNQKTIVSSVLSNADKLLTRESVNFIGVLNTGNEEGIRAAQQSGLQQLQSLEATLNSQINELARTSNVTLDPTTLNAQLQGTRDKITQIRTLLNRSDLQNLDQNNLNRVITRVINQGERAGDPNIRTLLLNKELGLGTTVLDFATSQNTLRDSLARFEGTTNPEQQTQDQATKVSESAHYKGIQEAIRETIGTDEQERANILDLLNNERLGTVQEVVNRSLQADPEQKRALLNGLIRDLGSAIPDPKDPEAALEATRHNLFLPVLNQMSDPKFLAEFSDQIDDYEARGGNFAQLFGGATQSFIQNTVGPSVNQLLSRQGAQLMTSGGGLLQTDRRLDPATDLVIAVSPDGRITFGDLLETTTTPLDTRFRNFVTGIRGQLNRIAGPLTNASRVIADRSGTSVAEEALIQAQILSEQTGIPVQGFDTEEEQQDNGDE